jgi:dTDP-4-amino-4,6-dideoxygalactose transaminase
MSTRENPPPSSMSEPFHVGRPNLGSREKLHRLVDQMLDRNWLSNDGPLVREFEQRVAAIAGVTHCVAMCNATIALEIATRAAGITGEVIIPAYTFVATAHALQWQGITPVFCDIDPVTHNLDPACIKRLITPKTSAIIGVHMWGKPCLVEELTTIADYHGLTLMFDAAHGFGCTHAGRAIGGFGLAEVFSFHATKFVNCAEGGAVVTNNDELAAKMRLMRNFGFSGYDNVIYVGTNGKMNELSAAMGLTSLDSMPHIVEMNRRNYEAYRHALRDLPGVALIAYDETQAQNYQYLVLDIEPATCPLTRDQLVQVLHAHNVLARRYFFPGVHRMEPYRSYYPNAHLLLPITEQVVRRVVVLPTGTAVTPRDVEQIGQIIRWAFDNAGDLRKRLPETIPPGGRFDEGWA